MTNLPRLQFMAAGVLATATTLAGAQSVWRCDAGGRVVYQGEPCAGGRAVDTHAARPAQDAAEALRSAQRQIALAERLAAERRARESQPVALAAGIPYTPSELSPSKKPRLRTKHPPALDADAGTWRAVRPASPRRPG